MGFAANSNFPYAAPALMRLWTASGFLQMSDRKTLHSVAAFCGVV